MKTARLHAPKDLRVENIPAPACGPNDILLRVLASAVCGTDVKSFRSGHSLIRSYPIITGHEFVGEIVKVGERVRRFEAQTAAGPETREYAEGRRVVVAPVVACERCANCLHQRFEACTNREDIGFRYDGGNAEMMLLPGDLLHKQIPPLFPVPDEAPSWAAAVAEPLACAVHAQLKLHRFGPWDRGREAFDSIVGIEPGDLVVVIGAGPLGGMHCELAKSRGATVLLAQRSAAKLGAARLLGIAHHFVCNAEPGALERAVRDLTDGDGADVVITACPSPAAQAQAVRIARKGGAVSLFGSVPRPTQGEAAVPLPTNLIHNNGPGVCGTSGASPYHLPVALDLIAKGHITPANYITHLFPLESLEMVLHVRGMNTREDFEEARSRLGSDAFNFLRQPEFSVAHETDPFQRVMAFKGSILKAICLPAMERSAGILSLVGISPDQRAARLNELLA